MSRRKKTATARSLIFELLFRLVGVGGTILFVVLVLNADLENWSTAQFGANSIIVVALVIAMTIMLLMAGLLFILYRRTQPQPAKEFIFEDSPTRNQRASQFEHEVAALISTLTGKPTRVTGGAGDGGVDIEVYNEKKRLVGVVQCKQVKVDKVLPPAVIRELNTVKHQRQVNIAYLVTTGRFSQSSLELAKELGVRLIGGAELENIRKRANTEMGSGEPLPAAAVSSRR